MGKTTLPTCYFALGVREMRNKIEIRIIEGRRILKILKKRGRDGRGGRGMAVEERQEEKAKPLPRSLRCGIPTPSPAYNA